MAPGGFLSLDSGSGRPCRLLCKIWGPWSQRAPRGTKKDTHMGLSLEMNGRGGLPPITFEPWHLATCPCGFWFRLPVASPVQNLGPLGSTGPLQASKRHWTNASIHYLCRGALSPPTFERKVPESRERSALTNLAPLNTLVVEPSLYRLPFRRYSQKKGQKYVISGPRSAPKGPIATFLASTDR